MIADLDPKLARQLAFIMELDRLKGILRQTRVLDGARQENSAEHSWHLALCAVVLAEHAPAGIDLARVLKMVLVHDVVEIDAGDAFCYDPAANVGKEERERMAAERIFGLLPAEQAGEPVGAAGRQLGRRGRLGGIGQRGVALVQPAAHVVRRVGPALALVAGQHRATGGDTGEAGQSEQFPEAHAP